MSQNVLQFYLLPLILENPIIPILITFNSKSQSIIFQSFLGFFCLVHYFLCFFSFFFFVLFCFFLCFFFFYQ
uniref:Uncharacterized protein n=1 Tax=Anguilla anguilla TaxID=7936 RepID=A0A0E9UC70_ANGAN